MSEPLIDPELLSAFFEGTARQAEREQVLRMIARSREAYSEFSEAAAIWVGLQAATDTAAQLVTIDTEVPGPAVPEWPASVSVMQAEPLAVQLSAQTRASRRRQFVAPVAMLAAAALVAVFLSRREPALPAAGILAVAQALRVPGALGSGSLARTLGADWDAPGWAVTRTTESRLAPTARAFRAGCRFTQFELAAAASDTGAVRTAARELLSLLHDVAGAGPLSAQLSAIVMRDKFTDAAAREVIARQAQDLSSERAWFSLGVWVSAAQVAARRGDLAFFHVDGVGIQALRRALSEPAATSNDRERGALRALESLEQSGAGKSTTLDQLRSMLASVADALGR